MPTATARRVAQGTADLCHRWKSGLTALGSLDSFHRPAMVEWIWQIFTVDESHVTRCVMGAHSLRPWWELYDHSREAGAHLREPRAQKHRHRQVAIRTAIRTATRITIRTAIRTETRIAIRAAIRIALASTMRHNDSHRQQPAQRARGRAKDNETELARGDAE